MQTAPLIGAKLLAPGPGPFHLERRRLLDRLAAALEGRATLVLGGPGYGKTCLVARFLQTIDADSVWYRADAADRDPWVLFRYLVQGVREHAPEFGEKSGGLWDELRALPDQVERLADIFIKEAEESLGGRLVLVLDDVQHFEEGGPCARAVKRLAQYLPGAMHLVLIGRSLPDPGLRTHLADESVHLIEGEELRFTPEETRALLLETFGLRAPAETITRVHERTRGWVTALQLLRQTARLERGAPDVPGEVFRKTEADIFDYFSEEVLAAESREVQEFLLGSSLLPAIDPEICSQVLPDLDVRGILARLVRRNVFTSPLESRGEYYAYDPLFRDFLRRKLVSARGPKGARDLERRYGRVFARRRDFTQALVHFLASEDTRAIADLLAHHGKSLLRSGILGLVKDAAQFVAGQGERPAVVEDLLGEACRLAGDYAAAIAHFEQALAADAAAAKAARQAGGGAGEGAGLATGARASALQGLAYSLLKAGDLARAAETATEALAGAGDGDPALQARILNTLSIIRYREDRQSDAVTGWQEALARARQAGDDHLNRMIAHNLGLPHAVLGDFRRASECFLTLTGPGNPRAGPEEGAAYLNLGRIETLRGDYARAAALLADAREIGRKWQLDGLAADVLEAEGNLMRDGGDLDGAAAKYAAARALFTGLGRLDLLDGLQEEEALLAELRGEHAEAARLAAACVDRRREAGDHEGTASGLLVLGEIRARGAGSRGAGARAGGARGAGSRAANLRAAAAPLAEAAGLFAAMGRAYQECAANLWLAFACHGAGDRRRAEKAAATALDLASRFDYRALVQRVAAADDGFQDFLARLPSAPSYLEMPSGEPEAAPAPPRPAATTSVDLTVRLLGPIEVWRGADRRIPAQAWKIRRALQLFCYLAAARDHRATKDRIADALWGEARPSVIDRNFYPTISFLRRALNHEENVPRSFILCERGAYLLNPAYRYDIDTERFEERIRQARRKAAARDAREALADYDAALALYRGPFLEEEYSEWTEAPRARFETLYLAALAEAGALHLEKGQATEAVACFRRLVDHDPSDEESSVLLMQALGAAGNRPGVEREFERLARAVREDLGSGTMPETRRAYEDALARAARRRAPGPPPPPLRGSRPPRVVI